jgi:hypothetical protein
MEIRPRLTEDEYKIVQEYRGIKRASDESEIDLRNVKHGWSKSKSASIFFTNPDYNVPEFDPESINWDFILNNVPKIKPNTIRKKNNGIFDRAVYTDVHIGMNPNPDGYSLYGGKWNEQELTERLSAMVNHILENQESDVLILDDLGDLPDGWDGKTARREHDLPQNMNNQTTFDVALNFKYQLFLSLIENYREVYINNICNDNHAGAFGYVINSAFKKMVEASGANNVTIENHRKFINHYQVRDNIFIITHGKDDKNLKFGFKPQLDKPQMEKIDNYIDEHYLLQPGIKIEFSKGDSHQLLFDWSSSDRFNYFNYPAFSPSSNWVQTNYKKGKSGFVMFNYSNTEDYNIKPLFFSWKK